MTQCRNAGRFMAEYLMQGGHAAPRIVLLRLREAMVIGKRCMCGTESCKAAMEADLALAVEGGDPARDRS